MNGCRSLFLNFGCSRKEASRLNRYSEAVDGNGPAPVLRARPEAFPDWPLMARRESPIPVVRMQGRDFWNASGEDGPMSPPGGRISRSGQTWTSLVQLNRTGPSGLEAPGQETEIDFVLVQS